MGQAVFDYFNAITIGHNYDGRYLFYNHLELTIETHKTLDGHERIVAFDVEPFSIAEDEERSNMINKYAANPYYLEADKPMTFTWSITTKVSI